ncbi:MAG: hypothetical protein LBH65_00445 [Desulfovibrio sp.]|jgi:hypothetical protein|nr:hypothetical protein [Desulfovibrio sp.]
MGYCRLSSDFYTRWCSDSSEGLDADSIAFALELIREAKYERATFYERECPFTHTHEEWQAWAKNTDKLFFILYRSDGTPLSMVWLDEFSATNRQAFSHFCTFKTGEYSEFVQGGRQLLEFIGKSSCIMQVLGLTPACYRHALKLADNLGYVRTALLKKAVLVHGKERDVILTVRNL